VYGDTDTDGTGGRIDGDTGEQQHAADGTSIGDSVIRRDNGDIYGNRVGIYSFESECDGNSDAGREFADGFDQSAGAGAGIGGGM
jgi:hypothetical protein